MSHICELPEKKSAELHGFYWECEECGTIWRAVRVWADLDSTYLFCDWKKVGPLRRLWAIHTARELLG